jgi:N-acetylglutamate synthase-like GNAT family acetyltransferase
MKNQWNINYRELKHSELNSSLFATLNRYQETKRVCYKDNDQFLLKLDYFIDEWDQNKKLQVIESLKECIATGGCVMGAFNYGELIGFASVEAELFGMNKEYLELSYIHVSNEFRNSGVGKNLFVLCCGKATNLGAKKLYIAAHPSEESQHFYMAVGCRYAVEINQKIYEKEPLDIQMECSL